MSADSLIEKLNKARKTIFRPGMIHTDEECETISAIDEAIYIIRQHEAQKSATGATDINVVSKSDTLNESGIEAAAKAYDDYTGDLHETRFLQNHNFHHQQAIRGAICAYLAALRSPSDITAIEPLKQEGWEDHLMRPLLDSLENNAVIKAAADIVSVFNKSIGSMGIVVAHERRQAMEAMTEALKPYITQPVREEIAVLPYDVKIGTVNFRKGVKLETLINAARRWYQSVQGDDGFNHDRKVALGLCSKEFPCNECISKINVIEDGA